jgi:cysteine desulfurase
MMSSKHSAEDRHYFDWAATAVPDILPSDITCSCGNPSSLHFEGRAARSALDSARARCAAVLAVPPETLYFTSGGTESNCIPLYSPLARQGGGRLLASLGEHSSITANLQTLERLGKQTGHIPLDPLGMVTVPLLAKALEKYPDARFAAIMAVNNETGAITDIAALNNILRDRKGPPMHFHCDMVQAAGKIPFDLAGCDSPSFSAHKIGGPRGIGLLYLKKPLEVLYAGGGQEHNIRPGTENVAGALALAECLEKRARPEILSAGYAAARGRWKRLLSSLAKIERCRLIPSQRQIDDERYSPYIAQAAFRDVPGEVMARALDDMGFAVSTGSACSSASPERPVLSAMGVDENLRLEGIRISQGWTTTEQEIDNLIAAISEVLQFL